MNQIDKTRRSRFPHFGIGRSTSLAVVTLLVALPRIGVAESDITFTMEPRVAAVEREGITGGGVPVSSGRRALLFYPNHPDDFGGTAGSGASASEDGGRSWVSQPDDWPIVKAVDVWADRMNSGELIAFGIHWVPDSKNSSGLDRADVPLQAYSIARSKDEGRTWTHSAAAIEYPATIGVIARPLPHIIERETGELLMPAYAWSKTGNSMLLLTSKDGGQRWTVLSTICTTQALVKAGIPVTTRWLETTVSFTKAGDLLAIMRTGSNVAAALVGARSHDGGRTWSVPQKVLAGAQNRVVAGKLPTLTLLPNGILLLLTAHTKNHCRLYASADGEGWVWSEAHIVSSQSGGNAGMCVADNDTVVISTPMTDRINMWNVRVQAGSPSLTSDLSPPPGVKFENNQLSWTASPNAAAYRVTPVLQQIVKRDASMEMHPHVACQTQGPETRLDLSRRFLQGSAYVFEITAVDREGRVSSPTRSTAFTPSK